MCIPILNIHPSYIRMVLKDFDDKKNDIEILFKTMHNNQ